MEEIKIVLFDNCDRGVLAEMITKLKEQCIFSQVFCKHETVHTWLDSIDCKRRQGFVFFERGEPVACVYFTNPTGLVAQVHFWGFKEAWGRTVRFMEQAMHFTARHFTWTHIYGRYSDLSPLITRAAERAGFEILGTIPNKIYLPDGRLSGEIIALYDLNQHRS